MVNTLKVEHFTAEDYDDYVLISTPLWDNKPFKLLSTDEDDVNEYFYCNHLE